MTGEPHTFTGKTVDVWCLQFRLSVAGQVAVSQVVSQDVNDVRLVRSETGAADENKDCNGEWCWFDHTTVTCSFTGLH